MTAIECSDLTAGYDGTAVVRGVDLRVAPGEVLAILGPNGAGKTTLLNTLAGLLPRIGGTVALLGEDTPNGTPAHMARRGLVLVPDDRSLFRELSARDNIALGARGSKTVGDAVHWFPELGRRLDVKAGQLSGGEQQMLAMARALVQEPKVLLIDEMSMGLAPIIVESLVPIVRRVAEETGAAVVLVEQHVRMALSVADRGIVLVHGGVVLDAPSSDLLADVSLVERAYLGGDVGGVVTCGTRKEWIQDTE